MAEKSSNHNELMRKRIELLMSERKLSKPMLAERTGISVGGIKYILNKECNPTAANLIRLADYFDVTLDYLTGRTDKR